MGGRGDDSTETGWNSRTALKIPDWGGVQWGDCETGQTRETRVDKCDTYKQVQSIKGTRCMKQIIKCKNELKKFFCIFNYEV